MSSSNEAIRCRYGLYETLLWRNGVIELADLHWQRLWKGLNILDFTIPQQYNSTFFEQQISELVKLNGVQSLGRIRIQFLSDSVHKPYEPFYFIEVTPIETALTQWNENGLVVGILEGFRKPMIAQSNCKISHSHHIPLAKIGMQKHSWDDILLMNTEGRIIESAIANLFWIKDGVFYTPPLSEACLAGTMRNLIIEMLGKYGFRFAEKTLPHQELLVADEVFLTNGIRKIRWVEKIEGSVYGNLQIKSFAKRLMN
jgi:branched-chain amino acid aminotransferase